MTTQEPRGPRLRAAVERVARTADAVDIGVRLENPDGDRALHYVSEVRAIRYDDATGRIEVRLTDEGRAVIPGAVQKLPRFGVVDPGSVAVLPLRLPSSIVRLRPSSSGDVELERRELGPDADIEIVIGWSDTAFYPDVRSRRAGATAPSSEVEWESGQVRCPVPREG